MRLVNTYLLLLLFCISFSKCFTLPTSPPSAGFGKGAIDLGGLLISQVETFEPVWTASEGGPENLGATFFEPTKIPDGFHMLGSYGDSNNMFVPQTVLVAKDATNDQSNPILKPPINYVLVLDSKTLKIKQSGAGYFWLAIPPVGYAAVGNVVTSSPQKPPLDKIRCVRTDFAVVKLNGYWTWGAKGSYNTFDIYSSKLEGAGNKMDPYIPTGTFSVQSIFATPSVSYLKNAGKNLSAMPNQAQIDELMKQYSPVIYFHPDEKFFPASVSWFFDNEALLYMKDVNMKPVRISSTGSNLPKGGPDDGLYWIDLPIDEATRERVKLGDTELATAYLHVKPTVGATCTDIVLYIFYPFNGPAKVKIEFMNIALGRIGEHVGDWEHVTLRISNFNGVLRGVYLSQHAKGGWFDKKNFEYEKGRKPVVYSSLHGHGSFNKAGDNLVGNGDIGIRNDAAKGHAFDTGLNYTIISADFLNPPIVEPPWLNYARKWGPEIKYDFGIELNKLTMIFPKPLRSKFQELVDKLPNEILGQEGPAAIKFKDNWDGDERV